MPSVKESVGSANKSASQPTTARAQLAVPAVPDAPEPPAGDTSARTATPRPRCPPPGARRASDSARNGVSSGNGAGCSSSPVRVLLKQLTGGESRTLSAKYREAQPPPAADILQVGHPGGDDEPPPAAICRERTWQRGVTAPRRDLRAAGLLPALTCGWPTRHVKLTAPSGH